MVTATAWSIARYTAENTHCWLVHDNRVIYWLLIKSPVAASVFLNFVFFANVVRVLATKLTDPGMTHLSKKYGLVDFAFSLQNLVVTNL